MLQLPDRLVVIFGLYRENTRMKENDIKFRMIRQSILEAARWTDTTFYNNPERVEKIVKKLEAKQLDLTRAKSDPEQQKKMQIKLIL